MKERSIIIVMLCLIFIYIVLIINNTKAMPLEEYNKILRSSILYSKDKEVLYDNIYSFIEMNDDILIGISSYEEDNELYNNYDYITNVAINYIIDNKELYSDKIINNKVTVSEIYNITNNFFNKNYYYVTSEDTINLTMDTRRFLMDIYNFSITRITNDEIICTCVYKYNKEYMSYKYIFGIIEDKVYLKNIEVV